MRWLTEINPSQSKPAFPFVTLTSPFHEFHSRGIFRLTPGTGFPETELSVEDPRSMSDRRVRRFFYNCIPSPQNCSSGSAR